jgi:hypothetical protein
MNIIYTSILVDWGQKMAPDGQGIDTVKLPSCVMYIPGYNFNCDSCWILMIQQHCTEHLTGW